jgi:hypothetical protein
MLNFYDRVLTYFQMSEGTWPRLVEEAGGSLRRLVDWSLLTNRQFHPSCTIYPITSTYSPIES